MKFKLHSKFKPTGDQPKAIEKLIKGLEGGKQFQTLMGVTGSGKTFTMANIIENIQKPTLIVSHNKTLAAQLASEFQQFFPDNAVCYFVSYYDYYQPEAYLPRTDTYIEKETSINDEINKYRHMATESLLTRKDVLIIATVSCIYGLGDVTDYNLLSFELEVGQRYTRENILRRLTDIQYTRSAMTFERGMFHVLGDTVDIYPPSGEHAFRLDFFGDDLENITEIDPFTGEIFGDKKKVKIFPAKHNVTTEEKIKRAISEITKDLRLRYDQLRKIGKNIEAERIKTRTEYDIEMLVETGYINGIENYTRYLAGRKSGEPPATLLEYMPEDFLMFIDESHITVPQIGGMYEGNKSRKQTLVEHGFRLPSAMDNRPLNFDEFSKYMKNTIFVSATPGKYENAHCERRDFAEQIIRPTGLLDPVIEIKPTENQIDDVLKNIRERVKNNDRVLVTTLTKKNSESLAEFLNDAGVKVKYLHSDIDSIERIEILRELREGKIEVIVGINLLREGLDLPEVSMVLILDADKRGFLRSRDALVQTIGRCARNDHAKVILYGDVVTEAMEKARDETARRREIQMAYNKKHGITPQTIKKDIHTMQFAKKEKNRGKKVKSENIESYIKELEGKMLMAAESWDFEKAMILREEIDELKGRSK